MAIKRLNIELTLEQYNTIATEAAERRQPVVVVVRELIAELQRKRAKKGARSPGDDPFYKRTGSFDGAATLAEDHDRYIYGDK